MTFVPDPDTGDLEASIGRWVDTPYSIDPYYRSHNTASRDATRAHGGSWSLRHTILASPPFVSGGYLSTGFMPVVATAPARGTQGYVTVTAWCYISSALASIPGFYANFGVGVQDADGNNLGTGSISGNGDPVVFDTWVQHTAYAKGFPAAHAAAFAVNVAMSASGTIPLGTYVRWDDFTYVGELAVASGVSSVASTSHISTRVRPDPPIIIRTGPAMAPGGQRTGTPPIALVMAAMEVGYFPEVFFDDHHDWDYIRTWSSFVENLYQRATNGGNGILVLGGGKIDAPGLFVDPVTGFWRDMGVELGLPVTYSFWDAIPGQSFDGFAMIVVASSSAFTNSYGTDFGERLHLYDREVDLLTWRAAGGVVLCGASSSFEVIHYDYVGVDIVVAGYFSPPPITVTVTALGTAMNVSTAAPEQQLFWFWFDEWPAEFAPLATAESVIDVDGPLVSKVVAIGSLGAPSPHAAATAAHLTARVRVR